MPSILFFAAVSALFGASRIASAADGSLPSTDLLGPGALIVGLTSGLGALWKLHLDDDKRERENAAEWKEIAQGQQADLAKLVSAVDGQTKAAEAEHELAKSERQTAARFREDVWKAVTRIQSRLER